MYVLSLNNRLFQTQIHSSSKPLAHQSSFLRVLFVFNLIVCTFKRHELLHLGLGLTLLVWVNKHFFKCLCVLLFHSVFLQYWIFIPEIHKPYKPIILFEGHISITQ